MTLLIIGHIIGTALGVGGATASDAIFFTSIKNGKLDAKAYELMKAVSNVVWGGLAILLFSGFGFFLVYRLDPAYAGLLYNETLWAKLLVVAVVFLNGLLMHTKVFPILEKQAGKQFFSPEVIKKAPLMFTTGAISIISWYTALILGVWQSRTLEYSFWLILSVYIAVLLVGISVSNLMGRLLIRHLNK